MFEQDCPHDGAQCQTLLFKHSEEYLNVPWLAHDCPCNVNCPTVSGINAHDCPCTVNWPAVSTFSYQLTLIFHFSWLSGCAVVSSSGYAASIDSMVMNCKLETCGRESWPSVCSRWYPNISILWRTEGIQKCQVAELAICLFKVISQYIDIDMYRGHTELSGGRAGHLSATPQLDHNM
jgi:hypothetical protein